MWRKKRFQISEWGGLLMTKKSGETECLAKTTPKSQKDGVFWQQKGPFLANFEGCQKSDKKWTIFRLNKAKKRLFFATKKSGTKSTVSNGEVWGAGRRFDILSGKRFGNSALRVNNQTSNAGCD